jgi:histidinol-phosphate aminotransferase
MERRMRTASVGLYSPDLTECRIDLSDNTNAWGAPPACTELLAAPLDLARYPSPYADDLKAAIAEYLGVDPSMITTGCGSDDVLDSAIRVFGSAGERLAFPTPTFQMVPVFGALNGLTPAGCSIDELARSGASVIYVCSPNNPTGSLVPRERIEQLLRETSAGQTIIVDEAYAEFAGSSVVDMVKTSDRLLVTRTMSKAFGLAGIRVGYAIGSPALIREVEKSRGPYKISALSERIAVAALSECDWMKAAVREAVDSRGKLASELRLRGLDPAESSANFLYVPDERAPMLATALAARGVRVRAFTDPAALRITVAPWTMMEEFLRALDEAIGECE